jgi:O-antigen/teichoic acid export membrane protein
MSDIKTLVKQSSHYFVGQAAILAAGFLSFPILTRIFSVSDYGLMSLVTTTLFIAVAVVKFGIPNSIVRFYAEYKAADKLSTFFATLFLGISGFAIFAGLSFVLVIQVFKGLFRDGNLAALLSIAALLIVTGCMSDVLMSFLRAEQKTKQYNAFAIFRRYVTLAFGIIFALYLVKGVKGYFLGQLLAGTAILMVLLFVFRNRLELRRKNVSKEIFTTSLRFGFPLVWAEFGHLLLNYMNRYLIQFYLGAAALGLYTAGYNLATHITEAIIYPINYAMTPVYMSILVKKGEAETKVFFTKMFRYFLLVLLPVVFGSIAVGKDLISILASKKYLESYTVLSYVLIGQAVYACTIILNSGLFINKKTHVLNNIMITTCGINILLNIALIPRFGIVGAAQATLLSYVLYAIVVVFYSFREFSFRIDYRRILLYTASSLLMFLAVKAIDAGNSVLNVVSQIAAGAAVYTTAVVLFDKDIRRTLSASVASARSRRG